MDWGWAMKGEVVENSVYGYLLPLHMLRSTDQSLTGVLTGYHGVSDIFLVLISKIPLS